MTERITLHKASDAPEIEITREQAEAWSGSGGGPQVVEIDVIDGGKYSRFFISIGINKRRQAVCEVATNVANLRSVRKTVTATNKRPLADHHVHGE